MQQNASTSQAKLLQINLQTQELNGQHLLKNRYNERFASGSFQIFRENRRTEKNGALQDTKHSLRYYDCFHVIFPGECL